MSITIDITVEAEAWHRVLGVELIVHRAIAATLADAGIDEGEVAVLLADDPAIRELNRVWRGKDEATNVLSFPAPALSSSPLPADMPDAPLRPFGDIVLAYETVKREAATEGKTIDAHLTHLAVHGMLHLLGYDHENDRDAETMESRERTILAKLGFADPYAERAEAPTA